MCAHIRTVHVCVHVCVCVYCACGVQVGGWRVCMHVCMCACVCGGGGTEALCTSDKRTVKMLAFYLHLFALPGLSVLSGSSPSPSSSVVDSPLEGREGTGDNKK